MRGSHADPRLDANEGEEQGGVERLLYFLAGGAVVFLLGAGVLVISAISQGADSPATLAVAGPGPGIALQPYITQRHLAIAETKGKSVAIVSLRGYVQHDGLQAIVLGVRVRRYLVAAPNGKPELTEDVAEWRVDARKRAVDERDELTKQISTLGNEEFEQTSKQDIELLNKLIEGLDAKVPVIFGVMVEGEAETLAKLVANPEVRLVDPIAPSAVDDSAAHGVRPEEGETAGIPPTRP